MSLLGRESALTHYYQLQLKEWSNDGGMGGILGKAGFLCGPEPTQAG